jgi:type IV secretion system protein VirB7
MTARMGFLALALATPLTGCATLTGAGAPSCDGLTRRPLNRSLWDWENAAPIEAPAPATPPAEPIIRKGEIDRASASERTAALPIFNIAASTRRCGDPDHG